MSKKIQDLEAKLAADKEAVAAAKGPNIGDRVNELKDAQARTEVELNAARMDRDPQRQTGAVDKLASEVATNKRALEIAMQADATARAGSPRVAELQAALKASEGALAAARRAAALADNNIGDDNMDNRNSNQPHDNWATSTSYAVGDRRKDAPAGSNWECLVAHTSGGGTMATDRTANPGHWRAI